MMIKTTKFYILFSLWMTLTLTKLGMMLNTAKLRCSILE